MRGQTFCLAVLVYANSMAEQQDGPTCDKVLMGFLFPLTSLKDSRWR